jgi:hypothetical protein
VLLRTSSHWPSRLQRTRARQGSTEAGSMGAGDQGYNYASNIGTNLWRKRYGALYMCCTVPTYILRIYYRYMEGDREGMYEVQSVIATGASINPFAPADYRLINAVYTNHGPKQRPVQTSPRIAQIAPVHFRRAWPAVVCARRRRAAGCGRGN